jgi:ribosomal protein S18 acetylase RimI-like enzyme
MIEIQPMLPEQWQLHKAVRCAALADAPYAFSSTLDDALKRSDEDWQQITNQYASHPNSLTFFAFENDFTCGMAACVINGEVVELYAVWVEPGCRGKGVGRALIDFGREWSRSKGAARIRVGIFEDNPGALAFYRSIGFVNSKQIDPVLSTEKRAVLLFTLQLR